MQTILKNQITNTLKNLGLSKGDTVIVHTSLKAMGYVCGDAQTVIEALIDVVESGGTIIMPTLANTLKRS
ncbi:MAG: AAC(3) family N-acetyltransferase [Succinivibrio sp.]|jgi:aminoglycoside 3-N-acetyltransferase|nr:AAC(3) family N-acetyltransferase [Succinivibrio sp.]